MEIDPSIYDPPIAKTLILSKREELGKIALLKKHLVKTHVFIDVHHDVLLLEKLSGREKFDLVILDESSIDLEVKKLCEKIKEKTAHVPILLITKTIKLDVLKQLEKNGITAFINEPLSEEGIAKAIEQLHSRQKIQGKIESISRTLKENKYASFFISDKNIKQIQQTLAQSNRMTICYLELKNPEGLATLFGDRGFAIIKKHVEKCAGMEVLSEKPGSLSILFSNIDEAAVKNKLENLKNLLDEPFYIEGVRIPLNFIITEQKLEKEDKSLKKFSSFISSLIERKNP